MLGRLDGHWVLGNVGHEFGDEGPALEHELRDSRECCQSPIGMWGCCSWVGLVVDGWRSKENTGDLQQLSESAIVANVIIVQTCVTAKVRRGKTAGAIVFIVRTHIEGPG